MASSPPDQCRPIRSLHEVWELVSLHLRAARASLHDVNALLYGPHDRIAYLDNVQAALKRLACRRRGASVESFLELDELVRKTRAGTGREGREGRDGSTKASAVARGGKALTAAAADDNDDDPVRQDAVATLQEFSVKCHKALHKLQQINLSLNADILCYLQQYCSDYRKLGIPDDKFDESLQSRTAVVGNYIERFDDMVGFLHDGSPIPQDLFAYSFFSQELAIELDCDAYPVLRVIPDLVQKQEMSCDILSDWLRGDKQYVQELERQIENFRGKVSDTGKSAEMCRIKYERLFTQLKTKQAAFNDEEENCSEMKRELRNLEAKRAAMDKELKTEQQREQKLASATGTGAGTGAGEASQGSSLAPPATPAETSGSDCEGSVNLTYLHADYAARSHVHARCPSAKTDALREKRRALDDAIRERKQRLEEYAELEQEIVVLSKKLRVAGRQKVKIVEQHKWAKGQLDKMVTFLKTKMHPEAVEKEKVKEKFKTPEARRKRKFKRMLSIELDTAFRLVRNNIGHGWKDLARALPYSPAKDASEINNEIQAIEYENQGKLKEQAYQTLVHWSAHNGRRASLEVLQETLRDLQQNRLADEIEKKVLGDEDGDSETEESETSAPNTATPNEEKHL